MTEDRRLALARKFERASFTSGVGISLGVWAGRGDWASMSERARTESGQRAVTELDQLIAQLTEFRRELAEAVHASGGAVTAVTRYTVSCIPEDISAVDHDTWSVTVEYAGNQRWAVRRQHMCLSRDGRWDYEPPPASRTDPWLDEHRFDHATARTLAVEAAPHVEINGMTPADVLARHGVSS